MQNQWGGANFEFSSNKKKKKKKKKTKKMCHGGRRTYLVQIFLQNSDSTIFKISPVGQSELRIFHKQNKNLQKKYASY